MTQPLRYMILFQLAACKAISSHVMSDVGIAADTGAEVSSLFITFRSSRHKSLISFVLPNRGYTRPSKGLGMALSLPVRISTGNTKGISNNPTTYQPLDIDEIRIIRIKPLAYNRAQSIPEAIIACDLESVNIDLRPKYTAISYAWGSGEYDQEIRIRGYPHFISLNLAEAIRHIRHETDEISLWADQLSINQMDDIEKTQQVQMMKLIYENASDVIAWLGSSADNSDLMMVLLQELAGYDAVPGKKHAPIISGLAKRISNLSGVAWSEQDVISRLPEAFDKFCNRTYWKRLWVIQEFAVCSELIIKCGRLDLQSRGFITAWRKVETLSSKYRFNVDQLGQTLLSAARSFVSGIATGRNMYREQRRTLLSVMSTNLMLEEDYNHPQCSDPRDRVFSLLGLASNKDDYGNFPDYAKPTEDIYEELARAFLREGMISILSCNQFPRNFPALPSWVPDWSMQIRVPVGWNANFKRPPKATNHAQRARVLFLDKRTIVLVGSFVDTVKETGAEWNPDWLELLKPNEALPYLNDIEKFCDLSSRIPQDKEKLASARIALADSGGEPGYLWDNILKHYNAAFTCFAQGEALPRYLDGNSDRQLTRELIRASNYAVELKRLHSRRVIITDSGYVGLAPSHVMKGDRICIFLGADAPYAIRSGTNGSFTLVGDCYIYGIMQGEFFDKNSVLEPIKLV